MGLLDNLGGGMAGMLQTPEGQEMVKKFLTSAQGQNMVIGFIGTPQGQQFLGAVLSGVVDTLNLPPDAKTLVRNIAGQLQGGQAQPPTQ